MSSSLRRKWDVRDAKTGLLIRSFGSDEKNPPTTSVVSPDGNLIAMAIEENEKNLVVILDAKTGEEYHRFEIHGVYTRNLSFSAQSDLLCTVSDDEIACIWQVATGHEVRRLHRDDDGIVRALFGSDGRRLVMALRSGPIILWDLLTGIEILRLDGHEAPIKAMAWMPGEKGLVTASYDCSVRIWDLVKGAERCRLYAYGDGSMAITPDNTVHYSGTPRILEVKGLESRVPQKMIEVRGVS